MAHEFFQKLEPAHARHIDVEGDDVGAMLQQQLARFVRIGRGADDFDVRVRRQQTGEQPPDGGRIVNQENPDHW
jgi:hypothetical protein